MRKLLALTASLLLAVLVGACDQRPTTPDGQELSTAPTGVASSQGAPTHHQELAQVRRATARYNDLGAAEADGYAQFSVHVPGMGFHYLTASAIGSGGSSTLDGSLDRADPEVLVYVDDAAASADRNPQRRLVAVEYAVPKDGASPPAEAVNLFSEADASDWHVHPSTHELPLSDAWTVHGECHYQGGAGVFLAENPSGDFVFWSPPSGAFGSWSGTVEPDECPGELVLSETETVPLPPLLIAHGKWWTLHAWVWYPNPEGVFHPTNPRVE